MTSLSNTLLPGLILNLGKFEFIRFTRSGQWAGLSWAAALKLPSAATTNDPDGRRPQRRAQQ